MGLVLPKDEHNMEVQGDPMKDDEVRASWESGSGDRSWITIWSDGEIGFHMTGGNNLMPREVFDSALLIRQRMMNR